MSEAHLVVRDLAALAARSHIRGRSWARSAILDPFTQMMEGLERWPDPKDRDLLRAMLKAEIATRLERISSFGIGAERRQAVERYVDLFFDGLLRREHYDKAPGLLERARLLKGAYLIFFREALPQRQRDAADSDEGSREDIEPEAE